MAVSTKPKLEVEIGEEMYYLNKVPDESSAVVKEETEKLLGAINLKTLVDDLGRVGSFIRIAYNGVGAAGPKFTDHQIEIQRLGYDVTKLCDKSALTIAKFKKASSSILTNLQATYEYLLDNLEEMALETLSAVSKLAGDMEKAALELHDEFVAEEKNVEKNCYTEENMAECAEKALHQAIGALKQLSLVMLQAANFWKQMQEHCCSLAESEMQQQVERALKLKLPDEKRLKVWTSNGFKIRVIEFYAGWVALNGVCKIYIEYIKVTQQDLYRYIAENPTFEESRQNVKELAEKFLVDLERDQKELTDKEFKAQEEINALGDSNEGQ